MAAMAGILAGPSIAIYALQRPPELDFGPLLLPSRSRSSPPRGKHQPRRHGQKLKSCRVKIGRRVRRKHRRAA
jgi:hypothetical protein